MNLALRFTAQAASAARSVGQRKQPRTSAPVSSAIVVSRID